jgi:hypothetical protein
VEPLDSLDKANLKLLDRPDLGITFTKVCRSTLKGLKGQSTEESVGSWRIWFRSSVGLFYENGII